MSLPLNTPGDTESDRSAVRLPAVQAMRGIAALAVTWFHLTEVLETSWLQTSGAYGASGVAIFFVLSGFVIPLSLYASHYELRSFFRFLAKRIVRLEPPYLASVILMIALGGLAQFTPLAPTAPWDVNVTRVTAHLFYLVPLTGHTWFNQAYWTLAYEFCFYLFAGMTYPKAIRWHLGGVLMVSVPFVAMLIAMSGRLEVAPLLFFIGFAAFRYRLGIDRLPTTISAVALATIVVWRMDCPEDAIAALVTFCVIVLDPPLRWWPLLALGSMSYSLYLLHYPFGVVFIKLCRVLKASPQFEIVFASAGVIASLAAAYALHRFVEEPARRASHAIALQPAKDEDVFGSR